MSRRLRFLHADDHALVQAGVQQILGAEMDVDFVNVENAREALDAVRRMPFDLILLDVTMPGRSGLDVVKEMKVAQPKTPVLMLSMHAEHQFALRALRSGASGYIRKTSMPEELIKAVTRILDGGQYVSEAFAECLARVVRQGQAADGRPHEALSAREFEVLRLIAVGKSGKEIAAELSLSFKTVSTYRTRLVQKLNVRTNADLTQYAIREGLIE
jgi:DNA-binding NarL/FixJ family response regulator